MTTRWGIHADILHWTKKKNIYTGQQKKLLEKFLYNDHKMGEFMLTLFTELKKKIFTLDNKKKLLEKFLYNDYKMGEFMLTLFAELIFYGVEFQWTTCL